MSLYDNLISAGLPVTSATEDGQVVWEAQMTDEQNQTYRDIVLQYLDPVKYAALLEERANKQQLKDEYQATITQLEQIENATSLTNAQVIAAVKYLARTVRLLLKLLARII